MQGPFGGCGLGGMVQVRSAQPVRSVQLELPSTHHRYPDAQYAAELVYTCVWGLGLGLPHAVKPQGEPQTESIIRARARSCPYLYDFVPSACDLLLGSGSGSGSESGSGLGLEG